MVKKDGILDLAADDLHRRKKLFKEALAEEYKAIKPFRMEEVSSEEMLVHYNQLSMEDMDFLIQKHGRDAVNTMIREYEEMKQKRGVK